MANIVTKELAKNINKELASKKSVFRFEFTVNPYGTALKLRLSNNSFINPNKAVLINSMVNYPEIIRLIYNQMRILSIKGSIKIKDGLFWIVEN